MPMPHRTFAQVAKRRLTGKEGRERIREVRMLLAELPDYRNGPYADLRKWLLSEIEDTRVRAGAVHRDSIAVRREGAAQVALVGPPNVGKSSLLQALSEIQIKTGDYPFTTLRPVPALTRIGGVLVQLVEIPGLIEGAADDRGGGRALLGVLRSADAIVYCCRADADPAELAVVRDEVERGRDRQAGLSRRDAGRRGRSRRSRQAARGLSGTRAHPGLHPRRANLGRVPRRDVAADRPAASAPQERRIDRPRAGRPAPGSDGLGGRRIRPPRSREHVQRCAGLGPVGPIRWPARGSRPPGRRRRHRRDRPLSPGTMRVGDEIEPIANRPYNALPSCVVPRSS